MFRRGCPGDPSVMTSSLRPSGHAREWILGVLFQTRGVALGGVCSGMRPRVLLVCTANICRSATAARLLAGRLGPEIEVESRGTQAVPGAGICDVSATWALVNGGASAGPHRSRQLELADVRAATLILTASSRHRAAVIELRPSAQVRTFTLVQAARIARWRTRALPGTPPPGADLPDRLLWLAEELDAHRGTAPQPEPDAGDDLPDPH